MEDVEMEIEVVGSKLARKAQPDKITREEKKKENAEGVEEQERRNSKV